MIQTVKRNEQLRKEYHILPAALMDAFDEGKSLGLAEGSRQKALEDARNFKRLGVSAEIIVQATGLTREEVEAIN